MSLASKLVKNRRKEFHSNKEKYLDFLIMESIIKKIPLVYYKKRDLLICQDQKMLDMMIDSVVMNKNKLIDKFKDLDTSNEKFQFQLTINKDILFFSRYIKDGAWHESCQKFPKTLIEFAKEQEKNSKH